MNEWLFWLALAASAVACQRWWYWKREAYLTRDAAFESFEAIKKALLNRNKKGCGDE